MTRCRQTYAAVSGCCSSYHTRRRQKLQSTSSSSAPVAAALSTPLPDPMVRDDLREIELCEWQGRLRSDVMREDPDNWNTFRTSPKDLRLNGGAFAPVVDCWTRATGNWDAIRADAEGGGHGVVFVMCHGAIGQCMLLQALGMDADMYGASRRYSLDNCEAVEVEWCDGEALSGRWRRFHPAVTPWMSSEASRAMDGGGLSCGR